MALAGRAALDPPVDLGADPGGRPAEPRERAHAATSRSASGTWRSRRARSPLTVAGGRSPPGRRSGASRSRRWAASARRSAASPLEGAPGRPRARAVHERGVGPRRRRRPPSAGEQRVGFVRPRRARPGPDEAARATRASGSPRPAPRSAARPTRSRWRRPRPSAHRGTALGFFGVSLSPYQYAPLTSSVVRARVSAT